MTSERRFPNISARNLEGLGVNLPEAFAGQRNVVIVAFEREHQPAVDSWVPWLEQQSESDPELQFYEIPTIGQIFAPARNLIDGRMAAIIRDPIILRRTMTVYGDVSKLTEPLGIVDRSTITVLVVQSDGSVTFSATGGFTPQLAEQLHQALYPD